MPSSRKLPHILVPPGTNISFRDNSWKKNSKQVYDNSIPQMVSVDEPRTKKKALVTSISNLWSAPELGLLSYSPLPWPFINQNNLGVVRLQSGGLQIQFRIELIWSSNLILSRPFGWIPVQLDFSHKLLMFLWPPKKHAKIRRTLPYMESKLRSWRQFKSGARSSSFELQIKSEGFRLHTSVQPVEPQTRVKSGRSAFFLPDFQFRFNLTVLQPNTC